MIPADTPAMLERERAQIRRMDPTCRYFDELRLEDDLAAAEKLQDQADEAFAGKNLDRARYLHWYADRIGRGLL